VTHEDASGQLTDATAAGLRWMAPARVLTELLLLVSMVVLARLIPPEAFGMLAVAFIVQELGVGVPSEGVGSALVQRAAVTRRHLEAALALSLIAGVVLAAATLGLALLLVEPVFGGRTAALLALTTPWYLLGAVLALPMALLRRRLDFRSISLLGLTLSLVRALTSVLLAAFAGLDASALVVGGLVGMTAMVTLALALAPVPSPRWHTAEIRDLLPYGGPATLACFAWTGFRNGDYAIVGARLGAVQAGIYWRGFQLAVEYQGKLSTIMSQVAFPVLVRTAGAEAMFALRRRMIRLGTVAVFPALALLAILAPVVIPWLFGAAWRPAVLPAQILTGAGAATVVIDAVGTALMAAGRSRALLGYGVAHFVVYITAVSLASSRGLAAVSIAAVSSHLVFLIVAYRILLRGRAERTLRCLWDDVGAAATGCVALAAVGVPLRLALDAAGTAAPVEAVAVTAAGAIAYLAALRVGFPEAWTDLRRTLRRVVPVRGARRAVRRAGLAPAESS
jgi:O-antigen/teichoic acid export membrane protein